VPVRWLDELYTTFAYMKMMKDAWSEPSPIEKAIPAHNAHRQLHDLKQLELQGHHEGTRDLRKTVLALIVHACVNGDLLSGRRLYRSRHSPERNVSIGEGCCAQHGQRKATWMFVS